MTYFEILEFFGLFSVLVAMVLSLGEKFVAKTESFVDFSKGKKISMLIPVIISIITFAGIYIGKLFNDDGPTWLKILVGIGIFVSHSYIGNFLFGIEEYKSKKLAISLLILYVVSSVVWTGCIANYNKKYVVAKNIETIESIEERKIAYFDNETMSGEISGSYFLGIGKTTGEIEADSKISYWYATSDNKYVHNSVSADEAKISFVSDEEEPSVEIIKHYDYVKKTDVKTGYEEIKDEEYWDEYIFYIPETIKK